MVPAPQCTRSLTVHSGKRWIAEAKCWVKETDVFDRYSQRRHASNRPDLSSTVTAFQLRELGTAAVAATHAHTLSAAQPGQRPRLGASPPSLLATSFLADLDYPQIVPPNHISENLRIATQGGNALAAP